MNKGNKSKMIKLLAVFFITFSIGGILLFSSTSDNGIMPCPFMSHNQVICQMSSPDHVVHWQNMFTAIPSIAMSLLVLLAINLLIGYSSSGSTDSSPPDGLRLYSNENPANRLYNYFVVIFSNGVLHPRLYS